MNFIKTDKETLVRGLICSPNTSTQKIYEDKITIDCDTDLE